MKINLINLTLTNFKGARAKTIKFYEGVTNIYGQNRSGKSTIFDAFLWLFFDKDSSDRKSFEIKTLDENNEPYHRLDHEVTAVITVDGDEIKIRKTLREKWTKPRGSDTAVFDGHETSYFWNEVPLKLKEFSAKVAEIINESNFKMISNPLYFNTVLDWNQRRATLLKIAGTIDENEIVSSDRKLFEPLMRELAGKKSLEEFKKQLAAQKKTIREELEKIPSRIDEAKRSMPEDQDYSAIEKEIERLTGELEKTDAVLMDKNAAQKQHQDKVQSLMQQRASLQSEQNSIEFEETEKVKAKSRARIQVINDKSGQLNTLKNSLRTTEGEINIAASKVDYLKDKKDQSLAEWKSINNETLVFNDDQFCCPTCQRELDADSISLKKDELTNNFNENKSRRLNENVEAGKKMASSIELLEKEIANNRAKTESIKADIEALEAELNTLEEENARLSADEAGEAKKAIAANVVHHDNKIQIEAFTADIEAPAPAVDNSELLSKKTELRSKIAEQQRLMSTKEQRQKTEARIVELEESESKMASEIAELEGKEFSIEKFNKAKMDALEQKVNGMFQFVKFRMFKPQVNGGFEDTCDAMVNGVPFADVNTAGKIQAGMDIINVLQHAFDSYVPVFIDNRESVTEIPEMKCQIINLYVSEADKKLRIEEGAAEAAMA